MKTLEHLRRQLQIDLDRLEAYEKMLSDFRERVLNQKVELAIAEELGRLKVKNMLTPDAASEAENEPFIETFELPTARGTPKAHPRFFGWWCGHV